MKVLQNALLLVAVAFPLTTQAAEKRVQRSDLPGAVWDTFSRESKGGSIREFSKETEHGRTLYEANIHIGSHAKDVIVDKTGAIIEVEEEIPLSSAPAPVQSAVENDTNSGKLLKLEAVTRNGSVQSYEATIRKAQRTVEVKFDPEGREVH